MNKRKMSAKELSLDTASKKTKSKPDYFLLLPKEIFRHLLSFIDDLNSLEQCVIVSKDWKKCLEVLSPWKRISLELWRRSDASEEHLISAQRELGIRWMYLARALEKGKSNRISFSGDTIMCGDAVQSGTGSGRKYWTILKCLFEGNFIDYRTFGYGCYTYSPGQTYKGQLQGDSAEGQGNHLLDNEKESWNGQTDLKSIAFGGTTNHQVHLED